MWRKLDNRARTLRSVPSTAAAILSLIWFVSCPVSLQTHSRASRARQEEISPHYFVCNSCFLFLHLHHTNTLACVTLQTCETWQKNEKQIVTCKQVVTQLCESVIAVQTTYKTEKSSKQAKHPHGKQLWLQEKTTASWKTTASPQASSTTPT